jgi:single-stranded DNA-specific DHH superfamily exonuclease
LPERLAEAATQLRSTAVDENAEADALISLSEVSVSVWNEVSLLAPFGVGNPKPRFLISEVIVTDVRRFGKESAHVELSLECRKSGTRARAFDFFRSPERFSHVPNAGGEAKVLASIERDSYRGGFALRLIDVVSRA